MWDAVKQQQLNELRRREQKGLLIGDERQALEELLYELEQEEWGLLRPSLDRLRQEQKQLRREYGGGRTQNAMLAAIAERQADLLERARVQLAGLLSEHASLQSEYQRALGDQSSGV